MHIEPNSWPGASQVLSVEYSFLDTPVPVVCLCTGVVSTGMAKSSGSSCSVSMSTAWTDSACDFACSRNLFYRHQMCLPVGTGLQAWDGECSVAIV